MKNTPTSYLFSMVRDILIIFLVCVLLVCLPYFKGHKEGQAPAIWTFRGDNIKMQQQRQPKPEKLIEREFHWQYPQEKRRETRFLIPEDFLKKEIKTFGMPHGTSHPFFLKKRGFNVVGQKYNLNAPAGGQGAINIVIDYKEIFQRNLQYFGEFTRRLMMSAELTAGTDPLYPFLSFVQYIPYQLPPQYYKGKFINSFFVPLVCLSEQYGDCDSKALLLAVFLSSFPNVPGGSAGQGEKLAMVLIRGMGLAHALLAVKRTPLPGTTSLYDFKKGYYMVLETTHPGWSPGFVNRRVNDVLKAGFFYFVELN